MLDTEFCTLELNIDFFHLDLLSNDCYLPSSSAQVILVRYVDDWHNSILAFNIVFFIILSNDLYVTDNQTWPILIDRQQSHKHLYFMSNNCCLREYQILISRQQSHIHRSHRGWSSSLKRGISLCSSFFNMRSDQFIFSQGDCPTTLIYFNIWIFVFVPWQS